MSTCVEYNFTPNSVPNPIVTTHRYDPTTYDLLETDKPAGGIDLYAYDGYHSAITTTLLTGYSGCASATTGAIHINALPNCSYVWQPSVARYDAYGERVATVDGRGLDVTTGATPMVTLDPTAASQYTRSYGYDAQGDQTTESTPPITTTLNTITTTAPVTTTDGYDGDGNRTSMLSANGNTTTLAYDHLVRQTSTTPPCVTLYDGSSTTPVQTTGYDGDGNVARTTDANGATTTSSYDPLGRQVSTTNPVSGTSTTTYNATEQVAAQDAQGNTTTQNYDAAGRLIQATDALTGTAQYAYDAAGNTVAITSGDTSGNVTQVESRVYDALNRAITDTVTGPGGTPQSTATYYDRDGNVYQSVQPTGGASVNTYDLADQLLTAETDGAPVLSATHQTQTVYRYDPAGDTVETIDPDGRDTTTTYDADNRATSSVATTPGVTGTTTLTTTLQYDPDGNTLARTVQTRDPFGAVQTFTDTATYNAADEATSATDNGLTTIYGYDAAG